MAATEIPRYPEPHTRILFASWAAALLVLPLLSSLGILSVRGDKLISSNYPHRTVILQIFGPTRGTGKQVGVTRISMGREAPRQSPSILRLNTRGTTNLNAVHLHKLKLSTPISYRSKQRQAQGQHQQSHRRTVFRHTGLKSFRGTA